MGEKWKNILSQQDLFSRWKSGVTQDKLGSLSIFTNGRDRHGGDRSLGLSVGRRDGDGRARGVEGRTRRRRRRRRRRRARQQGLEVSAVGREHALVRDELVLALVTDSHHRVGRREGVLETGIAGAGCGTAAEPRSVQTVHRPDRPYRGDTRAPL